MIRLVALFLIVFLYACKNDEAPSQKTDTEKKEAFLWSLPQATLPYQLTDTGLNNNKATDTLSVIAIRALLPKDMKQFLGSDVKFYGLAKIQVNKSLVYYIFKAVVRNQTGAFALALYNGEAQEALPFLIPDDDPTTTQISTIDANNSIIKSITRRKGVEIVGEGKDVYVYDEKTKTFSWVITDLLDDSGELVNPIDTMPKLNKLSGDYTRDKKNIVSIRDGRNPTQLLVFIHTEKDDGNCKGELKGELLITSSTSATYRQGGDPCILQLNFSNNAVTLSEERGCGNHRGLECEFEGTFTRKKESTIKPTTKKKK